MKRAEVDCSTGRTLYVDLDPNEVATRQADTKTGEERRVASDATRASRARLDELRAKGWVKLTDSEKTEAQSLMLDFA